MHQRDDRVGQAAVLTLAGFGRLPLAACPVAPRSLCDLDLVVDLGARIGSPTWFRGAATLAALIAATWHWAPSLRPSPLRPAPTLVVHAPPARPTAPPPAPPHGDLLLASTQLMPAPMVANEGPMRATGMAGASLYHALRNAGAPLPVVADFLKAIARRADLDDIAASDRFDLVFEPRRPASGEAAAGRLLYAGFVHGGRTIRLMRWTQGGRDQWFDAAGQGEPREGFTLPVPGARLSSGFGMRFHPILGFSRMHQGVDLAAPHGTPIVAAAGGVVRFAGWHGEHGDFVQIAHDGGLGTGYGHMSGIVVRPGETVRRGELIGYVGSSGLSTGPHCHFEVYQDGEAIDPATARFVTAAQLTGEALLRFRMTMARLAALPEGRSMQVAALPAGPRG